MIVLLEGMIFALIFCAYGGFPSVFTLNGFNNNALTVMWRAFCVSKNEYFSALISIKDFS